MAVSSEYREFIAEILGDLGPVRVKPMFGGAGVFLHDVMFGLIADDVLYLKTDATSVGAFEAEQVAPFSHSVKGRAVVMPYWTVPDRLYDDGEELLEWARRAYDAALKK